MNPHDITAFEAEQLIGQVIRDQERADRVDAETKREMQPGPIFGNGVPVDPDQSLSRGWG